jgi:hypothetical protein
MDDLVAAGADDQAVLDGGDAEVVGEFVAGVDGLRRR